MAVEQIRLIPEPKKRLLWFPIITTIIAAIMALIFHWRWAQPFTTAPIDLPMRKFAFAKNTDMLMFDDATQQRWESLNLANWWKGDWQDESGTKSQKGFHLFHMIHCLTAVRQEFAKLATDETRHITYNARDRNATTQKFHLAHCFDFLRQDVLCYADATLEPLGPGYFDTEALGMEHECRDWSVLMRYVGKQGYDFSQLR